MAKINMNVSSTTQPKTILSHYRINFEGVTLNLKQLNYVHTGNSKTKLLVLYFNRINKKGYNAIYTNQPTLRDKN